MEDQIQSSSNNEEILRNESSSVISLINLSHHLSQRLINLTYQQDTEEIEKFLQANSELDITQIRDKRDSTLILLCVQNNSLQLVKRFIKFVQKSSQVQKYSQSGSIDERLQLQIQFAQNQSFKKESLNKQSTLTDYQVYYIKEWINQQNDEGYTPLHFAAFKGNLEMIYELEKNGADFNMRNKNGLNVLHIAAQGDKANSLYYFYKKGLNINSVDYKGSTPLHWAAYLGSENAINFLTSWNSDMDKQDNEGLYTPLHLAVLSGNTRNVRRLLIRGANRHIKDKQDRNPYDLAKIHSFDNIRDMLENKKGFLELCNIKPTFEKIQRNRNQLYSFLVMYLGSFVGTYLFAVPYNQDKYLNYIFFFLFGITIFTFLLSWLSNPGNLKQINKQKKRQNFLSLLENDEYSLLCPDCEIQKPPRSRHCEYCNSCIQVYDHHCPWIDNCVGAQNHRYFLLFIIFIWIYIIYINFYLLFNAGWLSHLADDSVIKNENQLKYTNIVFTIGFIIIGLIFIFPLSVLVFIHIKNFLLNRTTSERFSQNQRRNSNANSLVSSASTSSIDDLSINKQEPENQFLLKQNPLQPNSMNIQNNNNNLNNKKESFLIDNKNLQRQQCFQQENLIKKQKKKSQISIYGDNCWQMCVNNEYNQIYIYGENSN